VGFIHLINENEFAISAATILDVGFLGLFPKAILQHLYKYANGMEKVNQDEENYMSLVNDLITAFIYQPIVMQKVIQIMLSNQKNVIENKRYAEKFPKNNPDDSTECASFNDSITCLDIPAPTTNSPAPATVQHVCHANKCWLLKAKGILRRPMFCSRKKSMCSGCMNESLHHKRVLQMEKEILSNISLNNTWLPLLDWIYTPITLTNLRQLLQHISAYKIRKHDDHLYGATRYLANSLSNIGK
jgi:hypothetical protein